MINNSPRIQNFCSSEGNALVSFIFLFHGLSPLAYSDWELIMKLWILRHIRHLGWGSANHKVSACRGKQHREIRICMHALSRIWTCNACLSSKCLYYLLKLCKNGSIIVEITFHIIEKPYFQYILWICTDVMYQMNKYSFSKMDITTYEYWLYLYLNNKNHYCIKTLRLSSADSAYKIWGFNGNEGLDCSKLEIVTNILEEPVASIFRIEAVCTIEIPHSIRGHHENLPPD